MLERCLHTHTHARTHARTHTHKHTHIHTHTTERKGEREREAGQLEEINFNRYVFHGLFILFYFLPLLSPGYTGGSHHHSDQPVEDHSKADFCRGPATIGSSNRLSRHRHARHSSRFYRPPRHPHAYPGCRQKGAGI